MPRMWPASSRASPTPQPPPESSESAATPVSIRTETRRGWRAAAGPRAGSAAGRCGGARPAARLPRRPRSASRVGLGELGQQAVDPGPRVAQQFAGADGRGGDVVGRLVAGDDACRWRRRRRARRRAWRLGISSSKLGAGVPVGAAADGGAEDDAVDRVDRVEDLGGVLGRRRPARRRGPSRPSVRSRGGRPWPRRGRCPAASIAAAEPLLAKSASWAPSPCSAPPPSGAELRLAPRHWPPSSEPPPLLAESDGAPELSCASAAGVARARRRGDQRGGDDDRQQGDAAPAGISARRGWTRAEPGAQAAERRDGGARAPREARGGALVELGGERRARGRAQRRAAPATSCRRQMAPSHASLSLVTARCSLVPALDSLTPSTAAISALPRPAKNLSAISSRSRGAELGQGGGEGEPALAASALLVPGAASEVGRLGRQLGLAAAAAQLVEGGVAGDPEQPGARLAAAGVEARALAVGALEGGRGHFLGRGPVADQAGDVGVDVVAAGAVELRRRRCRPRAAPPWRLRSRSVHALTTAPSGLSSQGR